MVPVTPRPITTLYGKKKRHRTTTVTASQFFILFYPSWAGLGGSFLVFEQYHFFHIFERKKKDKMESSFVAHGAWYSGLFHPIWRRCLECLLPAGFMFSFGVLLLLISPLFLWFFLLYLDFMIPFGVFVLFPPAKWVWFGWCASLVLCYFPLRLN